MHLPTPTSDFEPAPAGTHLGICVRITDMGTQEGRYGPKRRLRLSWELPDEAMRDGRPFVVSNSYTWSMHKQSTLRQHLEAWRGQPFTDRDFGPGGFDIKNLLGKACLVTIQHKETEGQTWSVVTAVSRLMKGQKVPAPQNASNYVWLDAGEFDNVAFENLHEKTREQITKSPEYQALITDKPVPVPAPAPTVRVDAAAMAEDDSIPW